MDYGLMAGLGEGLQQLGGSVFKAKFLDKLKEEEALRAEKRAEAKEAAKIAKQNYIQKDGVWYEQDVNPQGKVVDERLAPQNKVEEFNRKTEKDKAEAQKEALTLRTLEQTLSLNDKKLATFDEDRSLDKRLMEARIGSENRQFTPGAYRSGSGSTRPVYEIDGDPVTRKQAEGQLADNIVEEGAAPTGIAGYVAKRLMRSQEGDGEYKYEAPKYSALEGEEKEQADQFSDLALKLARAVSKGQISRSEAEKALKSRGFPQAAKGFDSWLKIARGR